MVFTPCFCLIIPDASRTRHQSTILLIAVPEDMQGTAPSLVLSPELSTITVPTQGKVMIPALRELCLRYKLKTIFFNYITCTSLPSHLCKLIELGPIANCESPKVLSITVTAWLYIEGNIVSSVVYFCSDQCAKTYVQEVVDEFSIWFQNRLEQACNVILN